MSDAKEIARLLCGECDAKNRRVMAVLVDSPNGAALRSTMRHVGPREERRESYDDLPIAQMPSIDERRGGWWAGETPAVVNLGCRDHSWVAITGDALREIEAEYRATGRKVVRILDHPPQPTL